MPAGNPDLVAFLRAKIRRDGPVTFEWFMEQALYHPQWGYYSSGQCQIGRGGDYFTNVSVGPLFGRIMAAQFVEMWVILGRPAGFTIVEQGAHHGDLARDVLEAARQQSPDFFETLRYWVLEPFPILQARQEETLRDFTGKVTWQKSLAAMPAFSGVHFSNELLDSMPVRLIACDGTGEWREKLVAETEGGFAFVTRPIAEGKLRRHLPEIPQLANGRYETEVNLAALDWVEEIAGKLDRGFVLTVDYGYPRQEYYAAKRSAGTLQCYGEHRIGQSPFLEVGRMDLTADVEWTSVAQRGNRCGLSVAGFTDQHHFVTGMLTRFVPEESDRHALQTLLHPEFLGTRFQYLALGKNAPATALSGFRFARDARKALW